MPLFGLTLEWFLVVLDEFLNLLQTGFWSGFGLVVDSEQFLDLGFWIDIKMVSTGLRLVLELLVDWYNCGFWTGCRLVTEQFLEWCYAVYRLLLDLYQTGFWTNTGMVSSGLKGT